MTGTATGPWSRIRPFTGAVIALVAMSGVVFGEALPPFGKPTPAPKRMPPLRPDSTPPSSMGPTGPIGTPVTAADPIVVRPVVAIIDLRADAGGDSRTLSLALSTAVTRRPELAQIADATVAAALIGPLVTESTEKVREARKALEDARDYMSTQFDLAKARYLAQSGRERLLETVPNGETISLLADLSFVEGQVLFAEGDVAAARVAFALVHRLSPGRTLDRAEHPPSLIDAFNSAATPPSGTATLEITATGTVWLDGQLQGEGSRTVSVAPGMHVVVATGPALLPRGVFRTLAVGATAKVTLEPVLAPPDRLAARARAALIAAPDPIARAGAMRQIAEIIQSLPGNLEMTDAVLVTSDPKGNAAVQLWRNRTPGFGLIRAIERPLLDTEADKLVDPLVPRQRAAPLEIKVIPREPEQPWYSMRRWYMPTSLAGGVILLIVGSVVIGNFVGEETRSYTFGQVPATVRPR